MKNCTHPTVICINPYELIRKYRCNSCGEVMMCACEEKFARRFLPHQLNCGNELNTNRRIPVTIGFQKGICNTCHGLPEEAHPMAPIYGRTTKIVRYYWREIDFETIRRFGEWTDSQGHSDWLTAIIKHQEKYNSIKREVIGEIKELHRRAPKYIYIKKSLKTKLLPSIRSRW